MQGDVVEIRSKYNVLLATYNYDAWGNVVSITNSSGAEITDTTHIAHINPIRYRSYYYDDDTGFYYLQSRYYDPAIGRFISSDSLVVNSPDAYGYNLFAYCGNNPVNREDPSGYWSIKQIFSNIKDALYDITSCVEISAGFGVGFGAEVSIYEAIGFSAECYYDFMHIKLNTEDYLQTGSELGVFCGPTFAGIPFGLNYSEFHIEQCNGCIDGKCDVSGFSFNNFDTLEFSFGLYAGIGGNISVEIDVEKSWNLFGTATFGAFTIPPIQIPEQIPEMSSGMGDFVVSPVIVI